MRLTLSWPSNGKFADLTNDGKALGLSDTDQTIDPCTEAVAPQSVSRETVGGHPTQGSRTGTEGGLEAPPQLRHPQAVTTAERVMRALSRMPVDNFCGLSRALCRPDKVPQVKSLIDFDRYESVPAPIRRPGILRARSKRPDY